MNDKWITHDGKGIPVAPETCVDIRYRGPMMGRKDNQFEYGVEAGNRHWEHEGFFLDIVEYRIRSMAFSVLLDPV